MKPEEILERIEELRLEEGDLIAVKIKPFCEKGWDTEHSFYPPGKDIGAVPKGARDVVVGAYIEYRGAKNEWIRMARSQQLARYNLDDEGFSKYDIFGVPEIIVAINRVCDEGGNPIRVGRIRRLERERKKLLLRRDAAYAKIAAEPQRSPE